MIRFVDLTEQYWVDGSGEADDPSNPVCAFFSTVDDRFIENAEGTHLFFSVEDFDGIDQLETMSGRPVTKERLLQILPEGFFTRSRHLEDKRDG